MLVEIAVMVVKVVVAPVAWFEDLVHSLLPHSLLADPG